MRQGPLGRSHWGRRGRLRGKVFVFVLGPIGRFWSIWFALLLVVVGWRCFLPWVSTILLRRRTMVLLWLVVVVWGMMVWTVLVSVYRFDWTSMRLLAAELFWHQWNEWKFIHGGETKGWKMTQRLNSIWAFRFRDLKKESINSNVQLTTYQQTRWW